MLPLQTFGKINGALPHVLFKILTLEEALRSELERSRIVVKLDDNDVDVSLAALADAGFGAVLLNERSDCPLPVISDIRHPAVINPGDVVRVQSANGRISVLFRRGANANSLFVTARCNSYCLMCSQPPVNQDDGWRFAELLQLIELIDADLPILGFTGGEPTLLGDQLATLFERCARHLPSTKLHVLTNGRHLADDAFLGQFSSFRDRVIWAIPLYADVAQLHDYVVQAAGAFDQTLNGLYNLAERGHRIEIRFVLHAQTISRLDAFAEFVYRNLPFVDHVAFMGLEPMGFAKQNSQLLWIDPLDYIESLRRTVLFLDGRRISCSIYNLPLCVLPFDTWHLARRSISDWKNTFDPVCERCAVRSKCGGFFVSAGPAWKSRGVAPLKREQHGDAGIF